MELSFDSLAERIRGCEDVLILTHANPDGDTLGSGFALLRILKEMNKRAKLFCPDEIPKKYSFLYDDLEAEDFEEKFVISVDVADIKLLGKNAQEVFEGKIDLAIDHHQKGRLFAKETYVEEKSASASEIIFKLCDSLGIMNKRIADCIYTGVSTDTGCFRFSNVTSRTHMIASRLIELGAEHEKINRLMFETKTKSYMLLERMCLERLELFAEDRIAVISVTRKMLEESSCAESDLDAVASIPRQIEDVLVGITLKEKSDGTVSASLRTNEGASASDICAHFGGGGHLRAAGCRFREDIEIVKEKLIEYITEEIL